MAGRRKGKSEMTNSTRTAVVGVFEDRKDAESAVDELHSAGFDSSQIGFAGHGEGETDAGVGEDRAEDFATGAAAGLIPGGIIGGVIGAAVTGLIPGVGPIISAGILAGTLGGAAAGTAAGGILGGLTSVGVSEEDAQYYESEFKAGRTLVTVKVQGRYDEAIRILRASGAYDIEDRGINTVSGPNETPNARAVTPAPPVERDVVGTDTSGMDFKEEQLPRD
jgi:hypothetical protein